jgi:hypothetical protein
MGRLLSPWVALKDWHWDALLMAPGIPPKAGSSRRIPPKSKFNSAHRFEAVGPAEAALAAEAPLEVS